MQVDRETCFPCPFPFVSNMCHSQNKLQWENSPTSFLVIKMEFQVITNSELVVSNTKYFCFVACLYLNQNAAEER